MITIPSITVSATMTKTMLPTVTPAMSLALTLSGTTSVDAATGVCCTSSSAVGVTNKSTAVGVMICKVSIMVGTGTRI